MKSKSTSKTRPIYSKEVEGAAGNINAAYGAQAPKVSAITDQLGSLAPDVLARYRDGDPNIDAAAGYNQRVLSGEFLGSNPELAAVIERASNQARNQTSAALGARGLSGGSTLTDLVSRNVGRTASDISYRDYETERQRMAQAAAGSPALAASRYLPIEVLQSLAASQQLPVQTAVGAGSGIGGLLGQYTNTQTKSSPSIGMLIAQIAGNAASAWAGGGFK